MASCLGKLFNSVINNRVVEYVERNGKLSDLQGAYRKHRSRVDHICILKSSLINKYIKSQKRKLYCCFVDFRKAFDLVPREYLLLKLLRLGIGGKVYNVIKRMYESCLSRIKLRNGLTELFSTTIGIKQGDSLSPSLFNLFINDIVDELKNIGTDPVSLNNRKLECLLYADDILLLSETSVGLQRSLDCLNTFSKKWGLTVNCQKTKIMIFHRGRLPRKLKFTLGATAIDIASEYNYLGIVFSTSGSLKCGIKTLAQKAAKALFTLRKCLSSNRTVDPVSHVKLFNSFIRPIVTYGCQIWVQELIKRNSFAPARDQSEQIFAKFCKRVLSVPRNASNTAVYGELGQYPLRHFILLQSAKYFDHMANGNNSLLKEALVSEFQLYCRGFPSLASIHTNLFFKLGIDISIDSFESHNFSGYIKSLEISLKEEYQTWFWSTINAEQGTSGKGG